MPADVGLLGTWQLKLYCLLHQTVLRLALFCYRSEVEQLGYGTAAAVETSPPSGLPAGSKQKKQQNSSSIVGVMRQYTFTAAASLLFAAT
jgi:hypothetical protein